MTTYWAEKPTEKGRAVNLEALGIVPLDLSVLERSFSEDENWNAIKNMPSDKSPGPDGMTGAVTFQLIRKNLSSLMAQM